MEDSSNDLGSFQPTDDSFSLDGPRYNPLDGFKRYRGGYVVDDEDYWASLAFLGIWGYAIAAIILAVGIIWIIVNFFKLGYPKYAAPIEMNIAYAVIVGLSLCTNQEDDKEEERQPKYIIALNIMICIVALLGSAITIIGGVQMIKAVDDTTDTMVITVDDLSNNASTVLDIVDDSYDTLKDLLSIDFAFVSNLETILENEDEALEQVMDYIEEVDKIQNVVDDNDDDLKDLYDDVQLGFIIMSAIVGGVILFGTIFMFASRRLYNKYFSQVFIPVANFLAIIIWISFGVVLVLRYFEDDSCDSFKEWNRGWIEDLSPSGDLTDIIPCPDNETVTDVFDALDQLIYDVITVANLGVEYFETETGQDLSDFYFCYPPLSSDVQPPPELDMPDTCQSGYDSTLILSPDCALLSAELCDQLEEFFFDVIPQLLKIVVDVLEARDILFVSLSCEFVFDLFTWVLDSQCKDDDWEALEGSTTVTLIGLGIMGSILLFASLFWIIWRNRKRTSPPPVAKKESDRSPSSPPKAKDKKGSLPPNPPRTKSKRSASRKTVEMVAK